MRTRFTRISGVGKFSAACYVLKIGRGITLAPPMAPAARRKALRFGSSHHSPPVAGDENKGRREAFAELVRRHQDAVYSICYRMMGDPAEAEDLAQEAFVRLYKSLSKLRPDAPLRPWLHRITANACLGALRKRKATSSLDEISSREKVPVARNVAEQPEEAYLRLEARLDVQRALLHLPAGYRVVLVLR